MESVLDAPDLLARIQICAEGGNPIIQDVLRAAETDSDTYVMVCACQQEKQSNLLKKALGQAEVAADHSVTLDTRRSTNEGILDRICERIGNISDDRHCN